jgi:hypothetical protein
MEELTLPRLGMRREILDLDLNSNSCFLALRFRGAYRLPRGGEPSQDVVC